MKIDSGFIPIDQAKIYYETSGEGTPIVMMHAGVADSRQWNNEFTHFSRDHRVLRFDMRGYGRSEPVDGDYTQLNDLVSLLEILNFNESLILMGCSMGGGLALDFALEYPKRVKAMILVGAGPNGLKLDVELPAKFPEAVAAFEAGDLDRTAELETQIWFDGEGRVPEQVHAGMRKLLYDMDRLALKHEVKGLGKRLPNMESPAAERLGELQHPVLIIVGEHDTEYIHAAADHMCENIPGAQKALIPDAAHLPNMDQPQLFQSIIQDFLHAQQD